MLRFLKYSNRKNGYETHSECVLFSCGLPIKEQRKKRDLMKNANRIYELHHYRADYSMLNPSTFIIQPIIKRFIGIGRIGNDGIRESCGGFHLFKSHHVLKIRSHAVLYWLNSHSTWINQQCNKYELNWIWLFHRYHREAHKVQLPRMQPGKQASNREWGNDGKEFKSRQNNMYNKKAAIVPKALFH